MIHPIRTHIFAFTYKEKEEAVKNGICDQTIRPIGKVPRYVEDRVLLHGWEAVPYYSKWSWRLENRILSETIKMQFGWDSVFIKSFSKERCQERIVSAYFSWDSVIINRIAERDFVKPATGTGLRGVIHKFYDLSRPKIIDMEAIRWKSKSTG
jgi:hypothetical protein